MLETLGNTLIREKAGVIPNLAALGYASLGHVLGLWLLTQTALPLAAAGVLLCAHTMVIAAYLIHEAAHMTLCRDPRHNAFIGEIMAFLCGAAYASFERIRHMHLRHHRDRADVARFNYKTVLRRLPPFGRRLVYVLEWAYVPAIELLMQYQLLLRPFTNPAEADRRGAGVADAAVAWRPVCDAGAARRAASACPLRAGMGPVSHGNALF